MKIIITNYKAKTILGIYPEEQLKPRDILISLIITFNGNKAATSDDIVNTIDYDQIGLLIEQLTVAKKYALIEALVSVMGNNLLEKFPLIKQVTVKLAKPQILQQAELVSVEEVFTRV